MDTKIALFQNKEIRKTLHNEEWWFVIEDVVLALIDSNDSKQYIQRMKERDEELNKGWVQLVLTLEVLTKGGKQKMNCANTEGFEENKIAAKKGGKVAGAARKNLELESGKKVSTSRNYIETQQKKKRLS